MIGWCPVVDRRTFRPLESDGGSLEFGLAVTVAIAVDVAIVVVVIVAVTVEPSLGKNRWPASVSLTKKPTMTPPIAVIKAAMIAPPPPCQNPLSFFCGVGDALNTVRA